MVEAGSWHDLRNSIFDYEKKEIELADGNLSQYDAQKEKRRKNRTENDVSAAKPMKNKFST